MASNDPNTRVSRLMVVLAKFLLVTVFLLVANFGFEERVRLLLDHSRYSTLLPYLGIWALAWAAVFIVGFQPSAGARVVWATVVAISSAVAWGYQDASQSDLTVFDVVLLWNSRLDASRAMEFYWHDAILALAVFVITFVILVFPAAVKSTVGSWLRRLVWFPAVPILLIGMIVLLKGGGGSEGLPWQFTPIALASVAGAKIVLQGAPVRKKVQWQPQSPPRSRNIIFLVDESIRSDFIDLTPGNSFTPHFAALAPRFVDFGPSTSGGDCSAYSNSILRFAASRRDLVPSVNTNPTLFAFAKRAGYRTVYIDGQASRGGVNKNPGVLQNYMTIKEKAEIDGFYALQDVELKHSDYRLAEIIAKELSSGTPVFIYANKNGAHFPYDLDYPISETIFHPSLNELGSDTTEARIASYRNAISWSVDRFMERFFALADLSNTSLVYTSDHGQVLQAGQITHCKVEAPDPRMGLVPLMAYSSDPLLRAELEKGADLSRGKASHFQIAPTLLSWMGYSQNDIATAYNESLTDGTPYSPSFTSGDIFGLFSSDLHWTSLDTKADYLEPEAKAIIPRPVPKPSFIAPRQHAPAQQQK